MSEQTAAAGWYPDSTDPSQRRYWNGSEWTDRTQPSYPVVASMPTSVTYVPARTNHVLHLILSLVTLGAWAPIWLTVVVVNSGKFVPQTTYGVTQ